jgi:hypothetical protein|tara:strand:+ start:1348 stop:1752 length:405 start_codon:yes stop_codon:yes gene_type:complete
VQSSTLDNRQTVIGFVRREIITWCAFIAAAARAGQSVSHSTKLAPSQSRCDPTAHIAVDEAKESCSTREVGVGGGRKKNGSAFWQKFWSDRHTAIAPSDPPPANRAPLGSQATSATDGTPVDNSVVTEFPVFEL